MPWISLDKNIHHELQMKSLDHKFTHWDQQQIILSTLKGPGQRRPNETCRMFLIYIEEGWPSKKTQRQFHESETARSLFTPEPLHLAATPHAHPETANSPTILGQGSR